MACMFALVAVLTLVAPANGAAAARGIGSERHFLAVGMQPEVVAHTLMKVEEEWKAQAAVFVDCSGTNQGGEVIVDCTDAQKSFSKSCSMVVSAVVQASNGDKDVVKEYMGEVCGQNMLSGWQKNGCLDLAAAVDKTMTADSYENRNNFDASQPCSAFWSGFLETEKERIANEEAERKEAETKAEQEEKKRAEEAAKKAKDDAEAEAKAEADLQKAEAERKKTEEVALKKKEAEEAAKRVEEAAKRVVEKKSEAEAVAKAAKEKMEEAARVEREHHELLAKAKLSQDSMPVLVADNATNATAAKLKKSTVDKQNNTQKTPLVAMQINEEPTADEKHKWGQDFFEITAMANRILGQLVFGLLYYLIIMRSYPMPIGEPTPVSVKMQEMNEVAATLEVSLPNCLYSWLCSGPRAAHTFYATGISDYWCSLIAMSICPCCVLFVANSFTDLNQRLGGEKRGILMSAVCSFCCSCCVIAQDAESLDLVQGVKTRFCGVTQA